MAIVAELVDNCNRKTQAHYGERRNNYTCHTHTMPTPDRNTSCDKTSTSLSQQVQLPRNKLDKDGTWLWTLRGHPALQQAWQGVFVDFFYDDGVPGEAGYARD